MVFEEYVLLPAGERLSPIVTALCWPSRGSSMCEVHCLSLAFEIGKYICEICKISICSRGMRVCECLCIFRMLQIRLPAFACLLENVNKLIDKRSTRRWLLPTSRYFRPRLREREQ
jgi:hypothetical protein